MYQDLACPRGRRMALSVALSLSLETSPTVGGRRDTRLCARGGFRAHELCAPVLISPRVVRRAQRAPAPAPQLRLAEHAQPPPPPRIVCPALEAAQRSSALRASLQPRAGLVPGSEVAPQRAKPLVCARTRRVKADQVLGRPMLPTAPQVLYAVLCAHLAAAREAPRLASSGPG